jgi:NAD(P)-dependent dehydrogenase (short-subunit alcohol dehydrogenase family)
MNESTPLPPGGLAVVVGASGTIGDALVARLQGDPRFSDVVALSRRGDPPLDLTDEASIEAAAAHVKALGQEVRAIWVATGFLHDDAQGPEKTWRHLDAEALARVFALNAIGPAMVLKHLLPLLPRKGRVEVGVLSARAASIAENELGGWYGYRASKAALNQLVRSAAAELGRKNKEAVCVTLHPGHVESPLSAPFGAGGNPTLTPDEAAARLTAVVASLDPAESGGFFAYDGEAIPW